MSREGRGEERNSWRVRNNPVETKTRIASTIDWRRHISTIAQYGSHCDRGAAKSAIMFIKLAGRKGVWGGVGSRVAVTLGREELNRYGVQHPRLYRRRREGKGEELLYTIPPEPELKLEPEINSHPPVICAFNNMLCYPKYNRPNPRAIAPLLPALYLLLISSFSSVQNYEFLSQNQTIIKFSSRGSSTHQQRKIEKEDVTYETPDRNT
ncbi:hypothetical protein KQX54_005059 [Cotesia glomerata]|uniref:Uncharacterized protein n=1 Tax=Cotesia glomerata TaxID=32391 RepID=A0AAV7ICK0_COTGL|nr:hypothetical protein KQX54_005059 [Cotesia glomerata]